jgi:hypothetical protein
MLRQAPANSAAAKGKGAPAPHNPGRHITGIAEPVDCRCPVFFPQQRQRHVRPPQIAMHRGPVRDRALVGGNIRQWRKQQRFEPCIVQRIRQRPRQARPTGPAEVVTDRRLAQPQAICDNALW